MKNGKQRRFVIILIVLCMVGSFITTLPMENTKTVKAYTKEQKQQAKAWLSAHGYPATKEGAYQAYQDYLEGKLTLSEEEQKRVNKSLGKSVKKKTTKNKAAKKKATATATPPEQKAEGEEAVRQARITASPSPNTQKKDFSNGQEIEKCGTEERENSKSAVIYLYAGGCVILIIAIILLVSICRRKSSR